MYSDYAHTIVDIARTTAGWAQRRSGSIYDTVTMSTDSRTARFTAHVFVEPEKREKFLKLIDTPARRAVEGREADCIEEMDEALAALEKAVE